MNEISIALIILIIIRSIWNLKLLESNLNWLFKAQNKNLSDSSHTTPHIYICVPVLREQSVIAETMEYMLSLDYPQDKIKLIIVTTEKEKIERLERRIFLPKIARDLSNDIKLEDLKQRYLGVFPSVAFPKIYEEFSGKHYDTTLNELEKYYDTYPTTWDIVVESKNHLLGKFSENSILVFHYPDNNKTVADQFNFAVAELMKTNPEPDSLIAFYNADSRPNLKSLKAVANCAYQYKSSYDKQPMIIQQSSIFTLNYNTFNSSLQGYMLKAASVYQSRWTLMHELFTFRSQSTVVMRPIRNWFDMYWNNQISNCVAHGMFVNVHYFYKRGCFPKETLNEDLPFGYYTCCLGEPIVPFPLLENSHSPESLTSLINQKSVWFYPYLEYIKCRNVAIQNNQYKSKTGMDIITLKALSIGVMWFLQTCVFLLPLMWSLFTMNLTLLTFWLIGLILYWFIPAGVIYFLLPKIEQISGEKIVRRSLKDFVLMSLAGVINVLLNSVGPYITIYKFVLNYISGKEIKKHKTER